LNEASSSASLARARRPFVPRPQGRAGYSPSSGCTRTPMGRPIFHAKLARRKYGRSAQSGVAVSAVRLRVSSSPSRRWSWRKFRLSSRWTSCSSAKPSSSEPEALVASFSSDWLYTTYQSRELVDALRANRIDVRSHEIESGYGHHSFLLEHGKLTPLFRQTLEA
jgi:hypothetical protein